jgi:hypothetical protein
LFIKSLDKIKDTQEEQMRSFCKNTFIERLAAVATVPVLMFASAGSAKATPMTSEMLSPNSEYAENTFKDSGGLALAATFESFRSTGSTDSPKNSDRAFIFSNETNIAADPQNEDGGELSGPGAEANYAVGETVVASSDSTVSAASAAQGPSSSTTSAAIQVGLGAPPPSGIPEPGTIGLLGSGLLLMLAGKRKRN